MNYDRLILELMDRVSQLEKEVTELKKQQTASPAAAPAPTASPAPTSPTTVRIGRDTTKYMLDGVKHGKSRLVLAVVQKYLKEHPGITAAELLATFDRSLQGSMGVIRTLEEAKRYNLHDRRFFCDDGEIITIDGVPYVVCSQWSNSNINNIIVRAKELGINVTIISIGGMSV